MGFFRWLITGSWKRQKRKPRLIEKILFRDRDDQRRHFTRDEIFRVARKGFFNFGSAKCKYCGTNKNLTVDHIIPLSRGGTNKKRNLQILCKRCNSRKRNRIRR